MDATLRELTRASATGDVDARARLLRQRVRLGRLGAERLALAARLGDGAARLAGGRSSSRSAGEQALGAWVAGLRPPTGDGWPADARDVYARVALGAARAVLPVWTRRRPADPRAARAVEALARWIEHPCPRHAEAAGEAGLAVEAVAPTALERLVSLGRLREAQLALQRAAWTPLAPEPGATAAASAAACAARATSAEAVRTAVREALLPWALGEA